MANDKFIPAALSLGLAAALWILTFLIRPFEFWFTLAVSTLILMIVSFAINREITGQIDLRMIFYGIASAVLLYAFFFSGFQITRSIPLFSEGVGRVYDLRSSISIPLIGVLLIFPIGPAEEIYWRGLIQRRFAERFGSNAGYLIATAVYALVHLPTLNGPLIMTAFIGGLVWGYLYKKSGNLVPVITSHVLWDLLIFVIAPLG